MTHALVDAHLHHADALSLPSRVRARRRRAPRAPPRYVRPLRASSSRALHRRGLCTRRQLCSAQTPRDFGRAGMRLDAGCARCAQRQAHRSQRQIRVCVHVRLRRRRVQARRPRRGTGHPRRHGRRGKVHLQSRWRHARGRRRRHRLRRRRQRQAHGVRVPRRRVRGGVHRRSGFPEAMRLRKGHESRPQERRSRKARGGALGEGRDQGQGRGHPRHRADGLAHGDEPGDRGQLQGGHPAVLRV